MVENAIHKLLEQNKLLQKYIFFEELLTGETSVRKTLRSSRCRNVERCEGFHTETLCSLEYMLNTAHSEGADLYLVLLSKHK